ncbi:MAG: FAD-dependent oxidoreductase [Pseudomonadota bacterium]
MSLPRIVIVGGGFGGAFTARYLRRHAGKSVEVELINSTNYFVFQPLLPEVVSGNISAPDAVTPLRQLLPGVRVRMGTVTAIDREQRRVHLLQGSFRTPQSVAYDQLVIAAGQKTNLEIAPGFAEHALCMRNLADAHELRNKIIRRLEHADVTRDPEIKRRLLCFVVAGGGFSGVETVGEVSEMIRRTLRFYPNIDPADLRVVIVQAGDRLLPELPPKLGRYAESILAKRGVEIILDTLITSATTNAVYLSSGERIETCLLVSTAGNGPTDFCQSLGLPLERGKLAVDRCLRAEGANDIWALGDAALIPLDDSSEDSGRQFAPPTAQFAVREARCLARNLVAVLDGREPRPFAFTPQGALASIGSYKGVARIYGVNFSGLLAWMTWRFLYIGMLPGFSTRLRVALNWMFDYFLPRSIVQIANQNVSGVITRRYAKGDVISVPGQYVDGFYTVLEGYLESRVAGVDGQEDFVRVLGPGDHWGERLAAHGGQAQGTLTASDDARVLVLNARDFRKLRRAFPALDEYFKHIGDKIYAPSLRGQDDPSGQ